MAEPDYIIVGAGSAGAALADQLSADGRRQVLVLEAGPTHRNAFVTMPKGIGKVLGTPSRTWQYLTEAHDGIPAEHWIRGRMLGGSSALNGMMYFRAQQADYDDWADQGATGWDGAEMARVFREMENHALVGEGRGTDGPLRVTIPESGAPLTEAFIAAGEQMGLQRVKDLNNAAQEGVGYAPHTISGGVRISSARAFLDRAAKRPNLRVVTGFAADRIVFDGVRAAGISGLLNGVPTEFRTAGEIILCAGAINSPAILQRSGVGDPARLNDLGIVTVAANPGVGEHLLEHRTLMLHYDLKRRLGENHEYRGLRLLANTLRYFATRGGLMAAPPYPASGFFRSRPGLDRADAQIIFAPYVMRMLESGLATEIQPSFQVFSYPSRPRSRGSVRITTADPAVQPQIRPNYLADPYDREVTVACYRYTVEWMRQPAIAHLIASERSPLTEIHTDDDIVQFYKSQGSSTFHSCGTCRMGASPDAVVDARLRVRGVDGLRVADASIMPTMPSSNINGPVMAVGWRAGEIIRAGNM